MSHLMNGKRTTRSTRVDLKSAMSLLCYSVTSHDTCAVGYAQVHIYKIPRYIQTLPHLWNRKYSIHRLALRYSCALAMGHGGGVAMSMCAPHRAENPNYPMSSAKKVLSSLFGFVFILIIGACFRPTRPNP